MDNSQEPRNTQAGSESTGWNQPRSAAQNPQGPGQRPNHNTGQSVPNGVAPASGPNAPQSPYSPYSGRASTDGKAPNSSGAPYGFGGPRPRNAYDAQNAQQQRPYAGQREFGAASGSSQNHQAQPTAGSQQNSGIQLVPTAEQTAPRRAVGLGTALAMMLVGAIAVGGVTGVVVGTMANDKDSTSTVNDVLQQQPVANSTGEEPADGSVEDVASKVLPAVVSIFSLTRSGGAEGSGSIISPDGYVLTNHHVVAGADQGGRLEVTMNDGSHHAATFVASDATTDVAVIKIDDANDLPYLQFGDSDSANVGQEVVAVGSPLGLNATVTSGIVSAKNRPVRASQEGGESSLIDAIQTDAAVNPGNSGGPLVDMEGNIIGMNSMIASLSSGATAEGGSIGLGFAIPSNFAKRMADELINNGKVKHPTLGVKVRAQSTVYGAEIVEVEPDSPADKAGLKDGDIVTRVNDRLIESSDSLIAVTRSQEFGATITLEVTTKDSEDSRQVEVTLASE